LTGGETDGTAPRDAPTGAEPADVERTFAAVFVAKGASVLDEAEIVRVLSFNLRWIAPALARELIRAARENGLLQSEGSGLRPAFDAQAVGIPLGFRPDVETLEFYLRNPRNRTRAPALPAGPEQASSAATVATSASDQAAWATATTMVDGVERLATRFGVDPDLLRRALEEELTRYPFLDRATSTLLAAARLGADVRTLAAARHPAAPS
jgi:hypothetical protein